MLMSSSPSPSPSFQPPRCSPSVAGSGYGSPPASSSSSSKRRLAPSPRPFSRSATHGHSSSSNPAHLPRPSVSTTHRQHSNTSSSSDAARSTTYVDAGTQYSPVDWPPTSSRATVNIARLNLQSEPTTSAANTAIVTAADTAPPPQPRSRISELPQQGDAEPSGSAEPKPIVSDSEPPPEPRLRVTPQSALQNVAPSATSALRRERSSNSDAVSPEEESSDSAPSAPKRARADDAEIKLLPMDYVKCDTKDLTVLISDMLLELIRYNDDIPLKEGQLTRFHSRAAPGISVRDYLKRLTFHATLSPPILLAMVCYIDKLCTAFPTFTINSLTVHRFLITAATVASKGLSDSFWTNNTYARVGGVTMKELALLELELLSKVEWRIVPTPEKLVEYYHNLIERHPDYEVEPESEDTTAAKNEDAMDTSAEPAEQASEATAPEG